MTLKTGTKVVVHFEGQILPPEYSDAFTRVIDQHGIVHKIWASGANGNRVFTVVRPIPHIADVWKTDDGLYVVRTANPGSAASVLFYKTRKIGAITPDAFFEKYPEAERVFDASKVS